MYSYLTVRLFSRHLKPLRDWHVRSVFKISRGKLEKGPKFYADVGCFFPHRAEAAEEMAQIWRGRGFASLAVTKIMRE